MSDLIGTNIANAVLAHGRERRYRRLAWKERLYAYVHDADNAVYIDSLLFSFGRLSGEDILAFDWVVVDEPATDPATQESKEARQ